MAGNSYSGEGYPPSRPPRSTPEQHPTRAQSYDSGFYLLTQRPQPSHWDVMGSYSAPGSISEYSHTTNPMYDPWTSSTGRPVSPGYHGSPGRTSSPFANSGPMPDQVAYGWTHVPSPMASLPSTTSGTHGSSPDRPWRLGVDIQPEDVESTLRRFCDLPPHVPLDFNYSGLTLPKPTGNNKFTWMSLIQIAIWSSPNRRLTLEQIYSRFEERFPDAFRDPALLKKMKGNIRHCLSLKRTFILAERLGSRHYWALDYRYISGGDKRERKRRNKGRGTPTSSRRDSNEGEEDYADELDDETDESSYMGPLGPSHSQSWPSASSFRPGRSGYSSSLRLSHPTYHHHHNLSFSPERMDTSPTLQYPNSQHQQFYGGFQDYQGPRPDSQ